MRSAVICRSMFRIYKKNPHGGLLQELKADIYDIRNFDTELFDYDLVVLGRSLHAVSIKGQKQ